MLGEKKAKSFSGHIESRKKGFTIIELLVVVAIVMVLATIMLPVGLASRAKARQATCMSNLHQIMLAISLYRADHGGGYPGTLGELLPSYANADIFICPEDDMGGYANVLATREDGLILFRHDPKLATSYLYVGSFINQNTTWQKLEDIPGASYVACVIHGDVNWISQARIVPLPIYTGRTLQGREDASVVQSVINHNDFIPSEEKKYTAGAFVPWALFLPEAKVQQFMEASR